MASSTPSPADLAAGKLPPGRIVALGLLLFAMFLGAGNVIFAPMVGQAAGSSMWTPMSGFLITGVGLVLLAVIALSATGGNVQAMANRVHPWFAVGFCLLLFVTLGPLYVIPRTTSVVYEISVKPNLPDSAVDGPWALLGFSIVFALVSVYLSLNPSKFVDRIGKLITPVFATLLVLIVAKSFLTPMGDLHEVQEPFADGAFMSGITEGYLTMDAMAALVFAGVFVQSIRGEGVTSRKGIEKVFFKAGLITVVGLAALHLATAWLGASSVDAIGRPDNGGSVLVESCRELFGTLGVGMIGLVIVLTGLTTNVACITCVADYFAKLFPKVTYRKWVWIHAVIGTAIANFGLNAVLDTALPILFLLYPLGMVLIILSLLDKFFGGRREVYLGAMTGAGIFAVMDALRAADIGVDQLTDWFSWIPLFEQNLAWLIPAVLGALIGRAVAAARGTPPRTDSLTDDIEPAPVTGTIHVADPAPAPDAAPAPAADRFPEPEGV